MKTVGKIILGVGIAGATIAAIVIAYNKFVKTPKSPAAKVPETPAKKNPSPVMKKLPPRNTNSGVMVNNPSPPPAVVPTTITAKEQLWQDSKKKAYDSVKTYTVDPHTQTKLSDVEKLMLKEMFEGNFLENPEYKNKKIIQAVDEHKDLSQIILDDSFWFLPTFSKGI